MATSASARVSQPSEPRRSAILSTAVFLTISGCKTPRSEPVENFRVVVPGKLSAGARLRADGVRWLRDHGIRTILNVEGEVFERVPGEVKKERAEARARGLSFIHLPLHPIAAPTIEQLDVAV